MLIPKLFDICDVELQISKIYNLCNLFLNRLYKKSNCLAWTEKCAGEGL